MKRSRSPENEDTAERTPDVNQITYHDALPALSSLTAPVSPPRLKKSSPNKNNHALNTSRTDRPTSLSLAAVEAGQVKVDDPLRLFSARLGPVSRPLSVITEANRLSIDDWRSLYLRNQHEYGCHFVIHQHDHPIAGPHYDLRLQFSATSSLSWAIMYGLPGDPNSRRINRNATETRVHCLWNHLIETGSRNTGSMIIWDTGEYEVLPFRTIEKRPETDDSASDVSDVSTNMAAIQQPSESEKLRVAFQNRKIRLRLHGTRLPKNYTLSLRLSIEDDNAARAKPNTPKRRRRRPAKVVRRSSTSSASRSPSPKFHQSNLVSGTVTATPGGGSEEEIQGGHSASASDSESTTDLTTRLTNAYPGANNSIGSIHQRRWFITLDRTNSGFVRDKKEKIWMRKVREFSDNEASGFEPFYVRGPRFERSVVTGRTGNEVLEDEKVDGFIPRQGWRPVPK